MKRSRHPCPKAMAVVSPLRRRIKVALGRAVADIIQLGRGGVVVSHSHNGDYSLGLHAGRWYSPATFLARHLIRPIAKPPPQLAVSIWILWSRTFLRRDLSLGFPLAWTSAFESPSLGYVVATPHAVCLGQPSSLPTILSARLSARGPSKALDGLPACAACTDDLRALIERFASSSASDGALGPWIIRVHAASSEQRAHRGRAPPFRGSTSRHSLSHRFS